MPRDVRVGIESLPAELLIRILEYGSQATLDALGLPFAITVSHVSKRWQELVYSSASVWRAIPTTSVFLLKIYLEKSHSYTIDIYLHARPRVGDFGVLQILNMLLDHSYRWRSLYIRATTAPLLFVAISRLRDAKVPELENFELYVDAQPHTVGQLPPIFVDQRPPRLSSITLEGVSFSKMAGAPMLTGLTSLTLARLPRGMGQFAYQAFRDLLQSSPQLKHLVLDSVMPRLIPDTEYKEITLPTLHSLELTIPPETYYVQQLFIILSAPVLRTLRYSSSWNLAWTQFELSLSILSAKFTNLVELYFTITSDIDLQEDEVDVSFFKAFPRLRLFSLDVTKDDFAMHYLLPWFELLPGDADDDEPQHEVPAGESVWPDLSLLIVKAPYDVGSSIALDSCLERLRDLRISLGLPFNLVGNLPSPSEELDSDCINPFELETDMLLDEDC